MSAADVTAALLVGAGGGFGAWMVARRSETIAQPVPYAVISGAIGAVAFLLLKPMLFGA